MPTKSVQVSLLIAAVCCTGWAHARLPHDTRADLGQAFVPSPAVADVAALGFDALLADYHWLQAIQVVGSRDYVDAGTAEHLGKLIDVVTTLNPHVGHPYRFAAIWLTHTPDQVRTSNRLLRRAIEHDPGEWRNHFYLGFNLFFFLGDFQAAAEALEAGMRLPGAPAYLPRLVARLKSHQGDIDVAEVFLRQLLENSQDENEIAKLESALDEIEIEYKARHLDRAREAFRIHAGRDLESVGELVRGPYRVLEKLPTAEPDAIPESLRRGSEWSIDPRSGEIVSSYLGSRYEVHFSGHRVEAFNGQGARDDSPAADANQEGLRSDG